MKRIIFVLLVLVLLATVSTWIYIDLVLNEKGIMKEMKNCNVLTDMTSLNNKRFLKLLDNIESSLPVNVPATGIYELEKLYFKRDPALIVTSVAQDNGVSTDGSIQSRLKVQLTLDQSVLNTGSHVNIVMYHYSESNMIEITVNGISEKTEKGYCVIVRWDSVTGVTEVMHKYDSLIFRPNVVKRIGAGLGICILFFFILVEKKKDNGAV